MKKSAKVLRRSRRRGKGRGRQNLQQAPHPVGNWTHGAGSHDPDIMT